MMEEESVIEIEDPFVREDGTRFTCEVCDVPLDYSGRGRHPRFCEEHKPARAASTTKRQPKGVASVRSGMEQIYSMLGEGVSMLGKFTDDKALVIDGSLIGDRSAILAQQWADLAERDPEVRRALTEMTKGSSWGGVIVTHVMLAGAIIMNHRENGTPREERAAKKARRNLRPVPNQPQPQPQAQPRPQPRPQPQPQPAATNVPPGYTPGPDALFESGS